MCPRVVKRKKEVHTSDRVVFLDRDGVINEDVGYLYEKEKFRYISGAITGMKALCEAGLSLIVVTNQSGIARGYYTEDDFRCLNQWMVEDLSDKGINIVDVYYCPHHPRARVDAYRKDCKCRKPGTELFYRAAKEHSLNLDDSFAIGDKERDLSICLEKKTRGFLLSKGMIKESSYYTVCTSWNEITTYVIETLDMNDNV